MNPIRPAPRMLTLLAGCLLAAGLWQIGEGSWIYAKARLAQYLLSRAWSHTLAGEQQVAPWPWADTWPVARLTVPSRHIDLIVLKGAYGRTLAFGPGHVESAEGIETAGTIILTGHRDTHFRFLQDLRIRDELILETSHGISRRFLVQTADVVDAGTAVIRQTHNGNNLVLVTCYPFDAIVPGGNRRYVVTAEEAR